MNSTILLQHLPVLQVVLPLLFAPLCVMANRNTLAWYIVLLISWATLIISVLLLRQVMSSGEISYAIGGWLPPWGIEYRIDLLNSFILLIINSIAAVVITYSRDSIYKEIKKDKVYLFYTIFLLHLAGLNGVVVTGDAFNMFVFIEIASLSCYAMISISQQRSALLAAYRYLIFGTIGATFILISVGLLYVMTGTLNIADMAERLTTVQDSRTIATALAFFTVGVCLKFGLFPLHYWLPDAYTYAPSVVSALLSGTTSKVFIYVLLRFLFSLFGVQYAFDVMQLDHIFMVIAVLAIIIGSLAAVYQHNIKKILAYSSIAQIGYMVLGISLASAAGLAASLLHLFNHALIKTALFMSVGCLFFRYGSVSLKDLQGAGRAAPFTMLAFVIAGLSLIGIPLTAGFISKWALVTASLEQFWWLTIPILIASLIAVIYIWKVVEVLYFQRTGDEQSIQFSEAPLSMLLPLWAIVLANVYFGIDSTLTNGIAQQVATLLMSKS